MAVLVLLLAAGPAIMGQPVINITLSGVPQNSADGTHPYQAFSASVGANLKLQATITGAQAIGYQWQSNQVNLANQTNSVLILTNVQVAFAASYQAVVYTAANAVSNQIVLGIDPAFTKVTTGSIVTLVDYDAVGGTWADYDQDGYLDLLIYHNQAAPPMLYHNNRDGTFTRVISGAPTASADGAGACWGDYDNDGYSNSPIHTRPIMLAASIGFRFRESASLRL